MIQNRIGRRFEVVLFDLGDTLIYFDGDWAATFELAKQKLAENLRHAGLSIGAGFLAEFSSRMGDYFTKRDMYSVTQQHWLPEPEALPTLNRLSQLGYRMALVSNAADDENTQTLVDKLGARSYFEAILSSAAVGIRKPDPRIFWMALERMHTSPGRAVMVGDSLEADITGAMSAGIFSIWVRRHADSAAKKTGIKTISSDTTIWTLSELPGLLESLA
jgi:HAD superfamily hydrolase (TIGR01549 family)